MTATVLDLSEGSRAALLRETLALAYGGLSARAGIDPATTTRGLADVCALAATIWGAVALCIRLGDDRAIYESDMFGGLATHAVVVDALLALSIGSALRDRQRLAGLSGLAWIAVFLESGFRTRVGIDRHVLVWSVHSVALVLIPLCGYVAMLLASDEKRRRHPARLGWLAGVILLGLVAASPGGPLGPGRWFEVIVLPAMVVAGLVSLAASTRFPLAFALAVAGFGFSLWAGVVIYPDQQHQYLLLGTTALGPALLVALAATRVRFTRKQLAS